MSTSLLSAPIPLSPLSIVFKQGMTTDFVTVLPKLTTAISPELALLLIECYPNALTETFDVFSLRIIDTDVQQEDSQVMFMASGDSRGGNLIGLNGGGKIEVDGEEMDLIGLIISDNNQLIQVRSTVAHDNTICFLYAWVKNPYGHILKKKDDVEVMKDIRQIEAEFGDVDPGEPFYQVGDYRKVGQ
jgi:hypothetical protein